MPNLRILVIDDSYRKRERICETLRKAFERHDLVLTEATDYEEAIAALTNRYYDLVVLDILLPAAGGSPSEDVSRALIHQIMRGTLTAPMHIIRGGWLGRDTVSISISGTSAG
jgi:CheY-like chemotaxis protein